MTLTGLPAGAQSLLRVVAVDRLGQGDGELRLTPLRTNASAIVAGPVPNVPVSLQLAVLSGGRVQASWGYVASGEQVAPAGFRVFVGLDGADPDWSASVATVGYASRLEFSAVLGPYAHGRRVAVGVRSVAPSGQVAPGGPVARIVAQAAAPPAVSDLSVEVLP